MNLAFWKRKKEEPPCVDPKASIATVGTTKATQVYSEPDRTKVRVSALVMAVMGWTRREARLSIQATAIRVNGKLATDGSVWVAPGDTLNVYGRCTVLTAEHIAEAKGRAM